MDSTMNINKWLPVMMTSSNGNIFRVTGPLCGEFTGPGEVPTQRPVTRSFDVFFDLCLHKPLGKQSWGWLFETPSWSLWRQCNITPAYRLPCLQWMPPGYHIQTYSINTVIFFLKGPIEHMPALVKIMAWRRTHTKTPVETKIG